MAVIHLGLSTEDFPDSDLSYTQQRAKTIAEDQDFVAAMIAAHPDICQGVHTEPCTDNPQPMAPVVMVRSCQGFDWPRGD
jgi:hypothetical protein